MALPEGWYPVAGDPADTHRFWDGEQFTTAAVTTQNVRRRRGFIAPVATSKWRMAGFVSRLLAAAVDYLAPIIIFVGIANATGFGIPEPTADAWAAETNLLIGMAGWVLINQVILVAFFGVTMGKILFGLRVVESKDRRHPPGLVRAIVREALLFPGLIVSVGLFLLGRREGVHDVLAGTSVVYA